MAKIIAMANHKGGVGKTTSTASLGVVFARMGKKVLLVDLDAQSNLTTSLMDREPKRTVYDSFKERQALPIEQLEENLYLSPSSLELAGIELELSSAMSREFILSDLLEKVAEEYDIILLDCPPSLGLITVNALVAANELYITLTAEALPTKGLAMLTDICTTVQKRLNRGLSFSGIIITRWEKSNLSRMVEEGLRATYKEKVFQTKIRKNVAIAEAPLSFETVISYAPDSNGAKDYKALAEEILERL